MDRMFDFGIVSWYGGEMTFVCGAKVMWTDGLNSWPYFEGFDWELCDKPNEPACEFMSELLA